LPDSTPDRESFAIVALGDFNPAIFQPLWFSLNGLMPEEETKSAEISIIHKQLASFVMGKIQVQVDDSRLAFTTFESPQLPLLRDLTLGTLTILEHSPLRAIGLNRDMLFTVDSKEAWHAVGDRLVPKGDWKQFLTRPGMRQVAVEGKRDDCQADQLNIRIQPSADREFLIAVNQHYRLETDQRTEVEPQTTLPAGFRSAMNPAAPRDSTTAASPVAVRERHKEAIRVLQDDWTSFLDYAYNAACTLLQFGRSGQHPEAST
jgi:hypothetical protein